LLRADVQAHGAAAVNEAGLKALGYPGILALDEREAREIRKILNGEMKYVHAS
jgi:hypothetical protein